MALEDRVRDILAEEAEREKNSNFKKLRDFYDEMKREGVATKQEYNLPPIDTVGRRLYEAMTSKADRRRR